MPFLRSDRPHLDRCLQPRDPRAPPNPARGV